MAPTGKFSHPASVVVVSSAILILLSVSATGERRCSWCGPLAEQVHRSQRAPPCEDPGEYTCDNGLSHCAIVASSPPYVESRLCVKYYQDECYSIFCNSTRTWRMTCPCRGDLCNKEKTEREDEAFAFIARLGSKIQNLRIKKRTVTPGKFMYRSPNKTAIVNNANFKNENNMTDIDKSIQTAQDNMTNENMSSEAETKAIDVNISNSTINSLNIDSNQNETNTEINTHVDISNSNRNDINDEDKHDAILETMDDSNITKINNIVESVNNLNVINNEKEVESPTSPSYSSSMSSDIAVNTEIRITQTTSKINDDLSTLRTPSKDINIDVINNIDNVAELPGVDNSIDEKISMKMDVKPSLGMPTAEALQQNASPAVGITETIQLTTEQTTEITTMMAAGGHAPVTATSDPTKMKKNYAVRISLHFFMMLSGLLHFI